MTQRTYYQEDGPVWTWWRRAEPTRSDVPSPPLRHGYTLRDVHKAAMIAISRCFGGTATRRDLYDHAWSAITEEIYSSEEPDFQDLVAAAQRLIANTTNKDLSQHGVTRSYEPARRFAVFWDWAARNTPSHENAVLERTALYQILDALPDPHREVLLARAAHSTRYEAAAALGITASAFQQRIGKARKRVFELWFEHATPPPVPKVRTVARVTSCRRGHEYTPENTRERMYKGHLYRYCRACDRERGKRK